MVRVSEKLDKLEKLETLDELAFHQKEQNSKLEKLEELRLQQRGLSCPDTAREWCARGQEGEDRSGGEGAEAPLLRGSQGMA